MTISGRGCVEAVTQHRGKSMLNHQTLQTLRSLRLPGMADGLEQQLA